MVFNQSDRTEMCPVLLWSNRGKLTLVFLVFWRFQKLYKLYVDVELNPQKQSDLQEDELELLNA